jgi:haloalkane dehalogenase
MSTRFMQALIVRRNLFVERLLPSAVSEGLTEDVMRHYRGPFPTPSSRAGIAALPGQILQASFWLEEIAYAVPRVLGKKPLLLPWGVNDFAFPPRLMDRFRRDFSNVTVRRIEAHHYLQEDAPAEVANAIAEFLGAPAPAVAADSASSHPRGAHVL